MSETQKGEHLNPLGDKSAYHSATLRREAIAQYHTNGEYKPKTEARRKPRVTQSSAFPYCWIPQFVLRFALA